MKYEITTNVIPMIKPNMPRGPERFKPRAIAAEIKAKIRRV